MLLLQADEVPVGLRVATGYGIPRNHSALTMSYLISTSGITQMRVWLGKKVASAKKVS